MTRFIVLLLFVHHLFSISGQDLALKINQRIAPTDSKADLSMILTNKKGKTRSSIIKSISKDRGKKQIMWFLSPADDKGIAFLKLEHLDKETEMRLWLPAFKKIRRISSNRKSDNFMGSDLSYEDLSNRNINDYNYSILNMELYDDNMCYVLISKPRIEFNSQYSQHISWIDTSSYIPIYEKSFDKNNFLIKEKFYKYKEINEYIILTELLVKNNLNNHSTLLEFKNIFLNTGFEDDFFQEKFLKRMPPK
tara:strand:+ start:1532 stop:2281 length:750 start_codon:yes stop_codon:yes gene_type:complete